VAQIWCVAHVFEEPFPDSVAIPRVIAGAVSGEVSRDRAWLLRFFKLALSCSVRRSVRFARAVCLRSRSGEIWSVE
jgi:hypothetical protein